MILFLKHDTEGKQLAYADRIMLANTTTTLATNETINGKKHSKTWNFEHDNKSIRVQIQVTEK